jgi:hypothetical protein
MTVSLKYSIDIENIYWFYNFDSVFTEYHDWVVNTPASYSEGPIIKRSGLQSRSWYPMPARNWTLII